MYGSHNYRLGSAPRRAADERFEEILRLLKQQRDLLARWPFSDEQIARDKELSSRIRQLVDRLRIPDAAPNTDS